MNYFEVCKGTVEDTHDPEQKARVRVRLDGYHTQLSADGSYGYTVSNEELDWYPVLMPTTSSSRNGKGNSPSGLLRGDRVAVFVLDEYIQSVLVIGTIHGDGDASDLSQGGLDGLMSDSVERTNNDLTRAPRLDRREYIRDLIENDDVGYQAFIDALVFDEGFVNKPYYDSLGFPTIGIGTLLLRQRSYPLERTWQIVEQKLGRMIPERRISREEAMKMAENDLNRMISEIPRFALLNRAYNSVSQTRKYGLLSMCYQMGVAGVAKFTNTLNLIIEEKWEEAYRNMLKSRWAGQTPKRATRVASIIRDNNFGQYPMTIRGGARARVFSNFSPVGDTPSVRMFTMLSPPPTSRSSGELPDFPDMTELQLQIIEKTKAIRRLMNIQSLNDIKEAVKVIMEYDEFIEVVTNTFKDVKDYIKSLRDVKIIEFIQRYIDRFKDMLRTMLDDIIKYVKRIASDIQNEINLIIEGIKFLVERIIFRFNNIGTDIDDFISQVQDFFSFEDEEDKEAGIMFTEPPSEYAGEYPYIKTEISDSGHIREVDDTPGFERLKETHRTGTYREVNSDGRIVEKSVSDKYLFVKGDDNIYVEGNGTMVVGGSMTLHITGNSQIVIFGDSEQVIRGNLKAEVDGNSEILTIGNVETITRGNSSHYTKGNVEVLTDGNVDMLTKGNVTAFVEGTTDLNLRGDVGINALSNVNLDVKGTLTTNVEGDSNTNVKGTVNINGDGLVNIGGSRINFVKR